jgi:hypothetical protein
MSSVEAITEQNLALTSDPTSKAKTEPHTLILEPVPPLPIGAKPPKDDDDNSTQASSPTPTDVRLTPVRSAQGDLTPKVRVDLPLPWFLVISAVTLNSRPRYKTVASS